MPGETLDVGAVRGGYLGPRLRHEEVAWDREWKVAGLVSSMLLCSVSEILCGM